MNNSENINNQNSYENSYENNYSNSGTNSGTNNNTYYHGKNDISSTNILTLDESESINNIYFNNVLLKKIVVKSKYLNENIENYISTYLKEKVEGICIDEGYIKPDSVKIIQRSVGILLGSRFTGDITYEIAYAASICNPVIGNVILCKVKFINKLGILANNGPLSIIIGRQIQKNEDFNNINIGDMIKVEVITKKFSLNDKEIRIIGKLWNENEKNNISKKNNKKEELISSDLTPILSDDNEIGDIEQESETIYSNENEIEDDYTLEEDNDDDLINSDDEMDINIKVENPDDIELNADDIELDEEKSNIDDEDFDDNVSVDYE